MTDETGVWNGLSLLIFCFLRCLLLSNSWFRLSRTVVTPHWIAWHQALRPSSSCSKLPVRFRSVLQTSPKRCVGRSTERRPRVSSLIMIYFGIKSSFMNLRWRKYHHPAPHLWRGSGRKKRRKLKQNQRKNGLVELGRRGAWTNPGPYPSLFCQKKLLLSCQKQGAPTGSVFFTQFKCYTTPTLIHFFPDPTRQGKEETEKKNSLRLMRQTTERSVSRFSVVGAVPGWFIVLRLNGGWGRLGAVLDTKGNRILVDLMGEFGLVDRYRSITLAMWLATWI